MTRQNETCDHCSVKPTLSRRKDGSGWRAIYWCFRCSIPAFGGDSFIKVPPNVLEMLPIAEPPDDKQGSLF